MSIAFYHYYPNYPIYRVIAYFPLMVLPLLPNPLRRLSKMFVDFVNKINSVDAISLKIPYFRNQFNMNKRGKFQADRLINVVAMTICSMHVSATRITPRR